MHIGEVLNAVYDEEIGWRPASGSIKPVHVANGLVRAITGRHYDISALIEVIVWRKGGAAIEDRRLDSLLTKPWGEALRTFESEPTYLERARRYLNGLLAADGAAFPTAENSSLSLTCAQMASRDHNDRGLGEFGFELIGGSEDGPLPTLLREGLGVERPTDPLTLASWPLLSDSSHELKRNGRSAKALKRKHSAAALEQIREAAASLATHEAAQGNRLRSVERAVHFICVATHAHAQALAAGGKLGHRPPALLVVDVVKGSDLAIGSERSLALVQERFNDWLAEKLSERIAAGRPLTEDETPLQLTSTDGREARALLKGIRMAPKKHDLPDDETLAERMSAFAQAKKRFKDDPSACLGTTLVECYTREFKSGGPREALTRLCTKAGLLYPHFQGRSADKRIQPSAPVIDMLVRSCVRAGEQVPLSDLLERLWLRFGFIVGGRRNHAWDDSAYLNGHGLAVDPGRLMLNTEALVSQLVTMGLARRYPDDVTFVGGPNAG